MILFSSCLNPFAPKLETDETGGFELGNLHTIDGLFQNLQYAYTFRDTTIYGPLIDRDFLFTYRDYEIGVDKSWGRAEEMKATYGLFTNAQRLDLIWNEILSLSPDSTVVIRSFELTVTFNPVDIEDARGKVNLQLKKNQEGNWKIIKWIDQSDY